ncbi:MAG: glycosyltransferase family 39 protein [Armatimonadota bacterium]|nr:glycosyltransferase family 39 protein [Armatimonadota bacterium]MDW8103681.1 glycosyltransferase family 39 protein [Armatimonadota bacterium]MDW8290184.1 glycosyltransferase family 39 protein [Armatimonadota bacterium]
MSAQEATRTVSPQSPSHLPFLGAWWVLAAALSIQLVFTGKPVHVDDPVVIHIARQILVNPLHPFSGELDWDGWVKPTFQVTTNPPLLSYYLALWMLLAGERERVLHIAMLVWQPLLWWGVVLLARRFGVHPGWATALVLLSAATIVSPNLMRDVPMVALWTLGTAWFLCGSDTGEAKLLGWGALVTGCAALMKYSGLGAVVLLGLYILWRRRVQQWRWVLLACAPFLLWCAHNLLVHGQTHFLATLQRTSSTTPLYDRLWGTLAGLGGVWWLWLWAAVVCRQWQVLLVGAGTALAVGWWRWHQFQPGGDAEAAWWSAAGAFLLTLTLFRAWQSWREQAFHVLWATWVLLAIGVGAPFAAARHLLPALPPLALLWLPREPLRGARQFALAATVLVQAAFGVYAGWCDAQIAEVYRRGAQLLAREHGAQAFIGHWGWMYYAQRAGLQQVSANRLPPAGAKIAIPSVGGDAVVPAALVARLQYEESVVITSPARLATLPPQAGFYAALRGAPPFRWLPEGYHEQFDLFRVGGGSP